MNSLISTQRNVFHVALLTLAGIVATTVATAYGYHMFQQQQRQGEAPIKKSWLPIIGLALEMGSKPIRLFQSLREEFGEVFGLITLGNRMFVITDPHSFPLIINASPKELSIQEFFETVESNFFGIQNHGFDSNTAKSGYSKHLFADSGLVKITERMQLHMQSIIQNIKPGTYGMYEFLGKIIFDASIAAMFNPEAGRDSKLYEAFREFDKTLPAACAGLDIKHLPGGKASRGVLIEACLKYREDESPFIASRWEVLSKLMSESVITSDDAVKYQLGMLWASVGNTMPATFWLFYYILSNRRILEKALEEVNRVCASSENTDIIPLSKLNQMVFMNACITETLRLSSGSLIMRVAKKPVSLTLSSGHTYHFRKGDHVGLCPPLTHLDNEVYENAHEFIPERWLVGSSEEEVMDASFGKITLSKGGKVLPPGVGYLPFGGGSTLCPGRKFARNEVKTLAVYILKSFKLSLEDCKEAPEVDGSRCGLGIFPPKKDMNIVVNSL